MRLSKGHWAAVTGASGGLGEHFARQLAARGMNVILVARSADKLQALGAELAQAHGIRTEVMAADLNRAEEVDRIAKDLFPRLPLDLLVNNAGLGFASDVVQQTDEQVERMINVNVLALTRLSRAAAAAMAARHRGAILNVGSTAAFQPLPHMAVYAATKAFVVSFGEALDHEVRPLGVQVTTFCPGPVATGFAAVAGAPDKMFRGAPSPARIAARGIQAIERGSRLAFARGGEAAMARTVGWLPRGFVTSVAARLTGK